MPIHIHLLLTLVLLFSDMVLIVLTVERYEGGAHSEADEIQAEVDGFLGCCGKFSCGKSHCLFDCWKFIDGYMLIASTDAIVTM